MKAPDNEQSTLDPFDRNVLREAVYAAGQWQYQGRPVAWWDVYVAHVRLMGPSKALTRALRTRQILHNLPHPGAAGATR